MRKSLAFGIGGLAVVRNARGAIGGGGVVGGDAIGGCRAGIVSAARSAAVCLSASRYGARRAARVSAAGIERTAGGRGAATDMVR